MLNRIYLFVLKRRLKRYRRDSKPYEARGIPDNWYRRHGIPDLEREIKELEITIKNPNQRTFVYCPNCENELISSRSFVSDDELVKYKCSECGYVSEWDFDIPAPIMIRSYYEGRY